MNLGITVWSTTDLTVRGKKVIARSTIRLLFRYARFHLPVLPTLLRLLATVLSRKAKCNNFFNAARYPEALAQFEQGQRVAKNLPQNYLGACMSLTQMIEVGAVPKEQIASYLIQAEQNNNACLRLNPTD